ncbi:carboxypeptidase-like regulatory domain-containing protein [Microbacterium cremeum]|uniref:carboxypeptidase-like regulatory domain-containing protein n=1 Tax=Microbacterium cremeum TaxID=2782169 RepID=UPI0018886C27|nr:carboxypeptidase-like regulatory domain-containing protein [Microbacterium cremeum]
MTRRDDVGQDYQLALAPVRAWAQDVTGLKVVDDWDAGDEGASAVVLRPLALAVAAASGPVLRQVSSAELLLDLLVTVIAPTASEAAAATSDLALAAQSENDWAIASDAPGLDLWRALGQPPVPAIVLRVPVRRVIERDPAPLVREPLRRTFVPLRMVTGRVVWPDGRPISAARVSLAEADGPPATTDHRGRFRMPLATASDELTVSITARGASVQLRLAASALGAAGDLGDLRVPVPTG